LHYLHSGVGLSATLQRVGEEDLSAGHAFISYVCEDGNRIQRVVSALQAADIPVWMDKGRLSPGDDWKMVIRRAIQRNSLAFIAVFSRNSQARSTSYQHEELNLAVEQFRQRPPGRPWLIPVRLDDCELPDYDLGSGRTLDSLQRVDLFGNDADEEMIRLITAVLRILGESTRDSASIRASVTQADDSSRGPALAHAIKTILLEPSRRIELEDLMQIETKRVRAALTDSERFPIQSPDVTNTVSGARYIAGRYKDYWVTVDPLAHGLATGCAWGGDEHNGIWTRTIRTIAATCDGPTSGNTLLLTTRLFPVQALVYAASLAAVSRRNYAALRAVAVDPASRWSGDRIPLIARMQPYHYTESFRVAANVFALEAEGESVDDEKIEHWMTRGGLRFTPISDALHRLLRPLLIDLVPDDDDYADLFDETEILLGVLANDAKLQAKARGRYLHGAWFGRFTWRDSYLQSSPYKVLQEQLVAEGSAWPPLSAGLFGGSLDRATAAFEEFSAEATGLIAARG
jgi:hypothetical protein